MKTRRSLPEGKWKSLIEVMDNASGNREDYKAVIVTGFIYL
jgi:hypothetical protein